MKDWLVIKMQLVEVSGLYKLHVFFCNDSNEVKTIEFSNHLHDAQLHCLSFFDDTGVKLKPQRVATISTKEWDLKYHPIQPGAYFE